MKNKVLPKEQRIVDMLMSVTVFFVVNVLVLILAFDEYEETTLAVFICIVLVYCFSIIMVLSYRVIEISDEIVFSKVISKPIKVNINEIKEISSIIKMLYVVKLKSGKLLVVFNHLGFGSLLHMYFNEKTKE